MRSAPLHLRKVIEPCEQLAAALHPVAQEGELHLCDDRSLNPGHSFAPVILGIGVAQPVVGDAHTAGEADLANDDEELAMGAMVESRDRVPKQGAIPIRFDSVSG